MAAPTTQQKRTMVDATMVAKLFNLTVRRIQQLTQDGVLATELVDKKRKYDLLLTVQRYIAYLQEKVVKKGEKHRSEDVEAMTTDLVFTIRSMMLALPGRLAIDLAKITKPAEISERIKQEIHAILLELSNYQYDADAYKKRVRDRQGWGDLLKDEDDTG